MSGTEHLTEADQRAVLIALFGIDPDREQYVDKAKNHE
jgi:hypothetical protein